MTDGAMIGPTIHPRGMARDRLLRFGKRRLGNVVHGGTWILGFIRPTLVAKLRCADGLVTPGNAPAPVEEGSMAMPFRIGAPTRQEYVPAEDSAG
ncbi:MAG: hypothetical protein WAV02_10480 [Stellaceae bacterium]